MGVTDLTMMGRLLLATELGLEDPEAHAGHCCSCKAATVTANAGANTLEMKTF